MHDPCDRAADDGKRGGGETQSQGLLLRTSLSLALLWESSQPGGSSPPSLPPASALPPPWLYFSKTHVHGTLVPVAAQPC